MSEVEEIATEDQNPPTPFRRKKWLKQWWSETTLATKITLSRLLFIPFILFFYIGAIEFTSSEFFLSYGKLIAVILFVIAAATDWLDGYVARLRDEVSDAGKLLDPIVDKILVLSGLVLVVMDPVLLEDLDNMMLTWAGILILFFMISREFIVAAVRQLSLQKGITIGADQFGKAKTIFQFVAITLFMLYAVAIEKADITDGIFYEIFRYTAWFTMITAVILSIASAVNYIIKFQMSKTQAEETEEN